MFDDDQLEEDVMKTLEVFTLEDILDHNDMTVEEMILALVREGLIALPEIRPV